jgi:hypothetical protein
MPPQMLRFTIAPSVALVILWSSGFIGAELGTREAPVSAVLWWPYLVTGAILVAVCVWRRVASTATSSAGRSCWGR